METSYLKTLELDKIIARAAEGCVCKESREKLLAIEPQCDPDEVRYALEQTDAINSLLIKNGSPRFGGVEGVSQLAARAVKGGVLSMGELLMVAGALRNFQNLVSWYGSSEHDALADEEYLKEAISNIVDNATKYSKEEINIQISTSENDRNVYIKIYDEGIGIARSEMKTIFNRFERAAEHERDARKTRGGFGIGLNYVLQVINAHGGKVSVKSEKGKWSEFTISLPK
jgi:signal transduction histidine kinase